MDVSITYYSKNNHSIGSSWSVKAEVSDGQWPAPIAKVRIITCLFSYEFVNLLEGLSTQRTVRC